MGQCSIDFALYLVLPYTGTCSSVVCCYGLETKAKAVMQVYNQVNCFVETKFVFVPVEILIGIYILV